MSKSSSKIYVYDTTVPFVAFDLSEFSAKASFIAYVFNQSLHQISDFLYFIRVLYQVFEPCKGSIIEGFCLNQKHIEHKFL